VNNDWGRVRHDFFCGLNWAPTFMATIRDLVGPDTVIEPTRPLHDGLFGFSFRVVAPDHRPLLVLFKGRDVFIRDELPWQGAPEPPEAVNADTRYVGHPEFWDWVQERLRRYGFEIVPRKLYFRPEFPGEEPPTDTPGKGGRP
jgi:hypothetical protein